MQSLIQPSLERHHTRVGFFVLLIVLTLVGATVSLGLEYMPPNPLSMSLPSTARMALRQVLPEGWGFFTKSQRDEYFQLYRNQGGTFVNAFDGPEADPSNLFGVSRKPRAEGLEIGMIEVAVGAKTIPCRGVWTSCAAALAAAPVITAGPRASFSLLCGRFVLVLTKPIPYTWARFKQVTMPSKLANVEVPCR